MELISEMHKYTLSDYNNIISSNSGMLFNIPSSLHTLMLDLDKEIVPIVVDKNTDKQYNKQKHETHHHKSKKSSHSKKEDLSWETIRNFKPTKFDKKEGVEKLFNDIRICLNKMSTKNYDSQKETIFATLEELKTMKTNTESVEKQEPGENPIGLQKIAESIFDIASTNKFYAEIYAKLYKELIDYDLVFNEVLVSFLSNYSNSIKDIVYVNPDEDYEGYCQYNKKNDMRKATAVFIVYLMKEGILPVLKVLSLIVSFQEISIQYVDEENRTNEIEEIAEILYLFLEKGITTFLNCKAEWIWKFMITKHINTFAKYKKNDKKSITSRAIFKYMDIVQLIEKQ
jgi:hypothetical protein